MIFGAGINQVELIKAAKELDVISCVIDPSPNPPGKEIADFFYQVKGNDYETTKQLIIKHKIDGIITGQMEKPLRLMAILAKEFDFIFNSPKIIECSLNKWLMKEAFNKHNIKCANGILLEKEDVLDEKSLKNLKYPLIIKPVDAFSSQGVLKINTFSELIKNEKISRSYSKNSCIIIEEFLKGHEFSVESLTFRGKTEIIQITEKFITAYPQTVEVAHLQPARISKVEWDSIEIEVKKAIKAINIDNCASHTEVMITDSGTYLIEIGARLGGDFISSYLTKASTGISMDKAAIQIALGIKPEYLRKYNYCSMIKYIELEEGKKVEKIFSLDILKNKEGYVFAEYFINEGDVIPKITNSAQRIACIAFKSNNYKSLFKLINKGSLLLINNIKLS